MSQSDKFQDLEETGETLVCFINSSQNDRLRHISQEQQALFDKHRETKQFLTKLLKSNYCSFFILIENKYQPHSDFWTTYVFFCFNNVQASKLSWLNYCPSSDVAEAEENAGQKLLDMEEQKKQRQSELEDLEEDLRQKTAKSQMTDSELQYPFSHTC